MAGKKLSGQVTPKSYTDCFSSAPSASGARGRAGENTLDIDTRDSTKKRRRTHDSEGRNEHPMKGCNEQ